MSKIDDFDTWWINGGEGLAERKYIEEAEHLFLNQQFVDEKVEEFYGKINVGDKDVENNVFWSVIEQMSRNEKQHLSDVIGGKKRR